MKKMRRTLGVLLAFGLLFAAPALAATSVSFGGGSANMQPGFNNMIRACDNQVDGHRVRAWYYQINQTYGEPTYSAWAPSGGCSEYQGTSWGQPMREFRVCVEEEGCSAWVRYG